MQRRTFLLVLCTMVLAYQVNASMIDFAKLIKSLRNSKDKANWKFSAAHKKNSEYEVSQDVLNEFKTYVDRLDSPNTEVSIDEDTDLSREMRLELDELRKSLRNPSSMNDPLRRGQRAGLDCGKFGCCHDNSKADSTGAKGCALKLCADVFINSCNKIFFKSRNLRERECRRSFIRENCPYTCGVCKMPAPPLQQCQKKFPGGFCCWDGTPAKGPNGLGCKTCRDKYRWPCKLFKNISRGCESNSWRVRNFMTKYCPNTCERCPY